MRNKIYEISNQGKLVGCQFINILEMKKVYVPTSEIQDNEENWKYYKSDFN